MLRAKLNALSSFVDDLPLVCTDDDPALCPAGRKKYGRVPLFLFARDFPSNYGKRSYAKKMVEYRNGDGRVLVPDDSYVKI